MGKKSSPFNPNSTGKVGAEFKAKTKKSKGICGIVWLVIVAGVAIGTTWIFGSSGQFERSPVVQISTGKIQGFVSKAREGNKFYSFLGIPFAAAPVGNLRFESPLPPTSWVGIREAFNHGAECKSYDYLFSHQIVGDEDCLFLNVFTSGVLKEGESAEKAKKKTIVFIHGGGLQSGSARMFGPEFFMSHEDVVLVTIQYRLAMFGFLSSGDQHIKGNMGFRDQVASLKWIQKNIAQFLGDPNDVTIIGESAGAASVHALMLSPMAKGLFSRGISWSTSILAGGRHVDRQNFTKIFQSAALGLNCSIETTKIATDCLKTKSSDELLAYQWSLNDPISSGKKPPSHKFYFLTVETHNETDAFITGNPLTLMKEGKIPNPVPWLYGLNEHEALIWVGKILQDEQLAHNLQYEDFFIQNLPRLIRYDSERHPGAAKKIWNHFFPNGSLDLSTREDIQKFAALIFEKDVNEQFVDTVNYHAQAGPVFLFQFSYRSSVTLFNLIRWGKPICSFCSPEFSAAVRHAKEVLTNLIFWRPHYHFGASHADELLILFNLNPITTAYINFYDYDMSRKLVQTVVDFASIRDFNLFQYDGVKWPRIEAKESAPLILMDLNMKGKLLKEPFKERLRFWNDLNINEA